MKFKILKFLAIFLVLALSNLAAVYSASVPPLSDLPVQGGNADVWGTMVNNFLEDLIQAFNVSHSEDGTLKPGITGNFSYFNISKLLLYKGNEPNTSLSNVGQLYNDKGYINQSDLLNGSTLFVWNMSHIGNVTDVNQISDTSNIYQNDITGDCYGRVVVDINNDGTLVCEDDDTASGGFPQTSHYQHNITEYLGEGENNTLARTDLNQTWAEQGNVTKYSDLYADIDYFLQSEFDVIVINRTNDDIGDYANSSLLNWIKEVNETCTAYTNLLNSSQQAWVEAQGYLTSYTDTRATTESIYLNITDYLGGKNASIPNVIDNETFYQEKVGNVTTNSQIANTEGYTTFDGAYSSLTGVPDTNDLDIVNTSMLDNKTILRITNMSHIGNVTAFSDLYDDVGYATNAELSSGLSGQDECSEISGCVEGALTEESDPVWTSASGDYYTSAQTDSAISTAIGLLEINHTYDEIADTANSSLINYIKDTNTSMKVYVDSSGITDTQASTADHHHNITNYMGVPNSSILKTENMSHIGNITNNNQLVNGAGYITSYTDTRATTESIYLNITKYLGNRNSSIPDVLNNLTFYQEKVGNVTNNNQLANGAGYIDGADLITGLQTQDECNEITGCPVGAYTTQAELIAQLKNTFINYTIMNNSNNSLYAWIIAQDFNKSLLKVSQLENDAGYLTSYTDTRATTESIYLNITEYLGRTNSSILRTNNMSHIGNVTALSELYDDIGVGGIEEAWGNAVVNTSMLDNKSILRDINITNGDINNVTKYSDLYADLDYILETELDDISELNSQITDATILISGGTLTSGKWCVYDGTGIDCNVEPVADTDTRASTADHYHNITEYLGGLNSTINHSIDLSSYIQTESDPVWTGVSGDYYTSAQADTAIANAISILAINRTLDEIGDQANSSLLNWIKEVNITMKTYVDALPSGGSSSTADHHHNITNYMGVPNSSILKTENMSHIGNITNNNQLVNGAGYLTSYTDTRATTEQIASNFTNTSIINITLTGDGIAINLTLCQDNEILKMDGTEWVCEADATGSGGVEDAWASAVINTTILKSTNDSIKSLISNLQNNGSIGIKANESLFNYFYEANYTAMEWVKLVLFNGSLLTNGTGRSQLVSNATWAGTCSIANDLSCTDCVKATQLDVTDVSDNIAAGIAEGELADSIIVSADIKDGTVADIDLANDYVMATELNNTDRKLNNLTVTNTNTTIGKFIVYELNSSCVCWGRSTTTGSCDCS